MPDPLWPISSLARRGRLLYPCIPMGTPMENGTVSWDSAEKGFGFITPEGGGPDVVVYPETLEAAGIGALEVGMAVAFSAEPYRLARKAVTVERAP